MKVTRIIARTSFLGVLFSLSAGTCHLKALERSDLLLYSDFEDRVEPMISQGGMTQTKEVPEFAPGVRGKAVLTGAQGRDNAKGPISYEGEGNHRSEAGTIALWVQPQNWQAPDGVNHYFLNTGVSGFTKLLYLFYPGDTGIYLADADGRIETVREQMDWTFWQPGRWRSLIYTWQQNKGSLYLDGRLVKSNENIPIAPSEVNGIFLGDDSAVNKTAFDEFMIFSRPLTPVEVKAIYQRPLRRSPKPVVTAMPSKASILVDGVLADAGWTSTSTVKGWLDSVLGVMNDDLTEWMVTYDAQGLVVAWRWPLPDAYRMNPTNYVGSPVSQQITKRDGAITEDDSVTVAIRPPGSQDVYHFGVSASGAMRDAKNDDVAWNAEWTARSRNGMESWDGEMKIPYRALGVKAPAAGEAWGFNIAHNARRVETLDSVWAFSGSDPIALGELRFDEGAIAVRQQKVTNPKSGQVEVALELVNHSASTVEGIAEVRVQEYSRKEFSDPPDPLYANEGDARERYSDRKSFSLQAGQSLPLSFEHRLDQMTDANLIVDISTNRGETASRGVLPFVYSLNGELELEYFPSYERLSLVIERGVETSDEQGSTAQIRVVRKGESTPVIESQHRLSATRETVKVSVPGLSPGEYEVIVALPNAADKAFEMRQPFHVEAKPDWLGNQIGITGEVPSPWTPVEVKESATSTVEVWGRSYEFGDSILPNQIVSNGQPLLSSAIVLRSGSDVIKGVAPKFTRINEQRVEISNSGRLHGCEVIVEQWLEFDGLLWTKVKIIPPPGGVKLPDLSIEIPMRPESATLWYSAEYSPTGKTGAIPKEGVHSSEANFVMLGDEERGLQICWESTRGWNLSDKSYAVQITPDSGKVIWKTAIIDNSTHLTEPLELAFGLQATPVRPLRSDHRLWRFGSSDLSLSNLPPGKYLNLYNEKFSPHWSYPRYSEETYAGAEGSVSHAMEQNFSQAMYFNMLYSDANVPEYSYWGAEWRARPSTSPDLVDVSPQTQVRYLVSLAEKSYVDWYLYHLKEMAERLPDNFFGGLYWDNSGFNSLSNDEQGHGWQDADGVWHPTYTVLASREFMKRVYIMLKEVKPDAWNAIHTSGAPAMAYASFSDVVIEGEQFFSYFKQQSVDPEYPQSYERSLSLEKFRAQFMPQRWGPLVVNLIELGAFSRNDEDHHRWYETEEMDPAVEHIAGMILVHDSLPWPGFSRSEPWWRIYRIQNAFVWDDKVSFVPYWRAPSFYKPLTNMPTEMVASVYRRPDKAMLVVFNNTDEPQTFAAKIDFAALGLNPSQIKMSDIEVADRYDGQAASISGDEIIMPVKKRNYRIITFDQ